MPPAARWQALQNDLHTNVGDGLNKALAALEEENSSLSGVLGHIDFNRKVGQTKITDQKLRDLIRHFSQVPLRMELLLSFERALVPVGLLDRFKVAGVIARWWGETQYDLKTLMTRGFVGLVEAWISTIRT